jgi:hypothetical protein
VNRANTSPVASAVKMSETTDSAATRLSASIDCGYIAP